VSPTDDWKARYRKEARDWERTDQLLRRLVSRLVIAAEGQSPELDRALEQVQQHTRDGQWSALEQDLDVLVRQIQRMDSVTPGVPIEPEEPASAVASDTTAGSREVREALLAIVDEMSASQPGQGGFETLRESLQAEPRSNWHRQLDRLIAEIRGLIQRISSEKLALEQLMQEVSQELGGITQVLGEEFSGLQQGREQSQKLQTLMRDGVESIQSHIESESDIAALKARVSRSLEGIRSGISEFIKKDDERYSSAENRNAELRERIQKMEEETEQLRSKLSRNRDKLMKDTLTGARSRLAYDEMLAQELSRYQRYREAFCLAVLDLDFFKRVNDDFGHSAGDKALQLVVRMVSERIRETDAIFRVGGEEFALLLPRTALAAAATLLETIRQAVGGSGFHYEGKPVAITLSVGVTAVREDDTAETLFARADDAMYRAKKAGRDRLVTLE
jgi:diguanylate cyclase